MNWQRLVVVVGMAVLVGGCNGSVPTAAPGSSPAVSAPSASPSVAPSDSAVGPTGSPSASPKAAAVPPAPSRTTFKLVKETVAKDGYTTTERYRATWSEPAGAATKFLVYGVPDCLGDLQQFNNTPCVTPDTAIPANELKLFATLSAATRSTFVTWTIQNEAGLGPYQAVVIVAQNAAGKSAPAVLWSARVCYGCVI